MANLGRRGQGAGLVAEIPVIIEIDGKSYRASVEPRMLLVHFIRRVAGITAPKIGCDTSHCGACTVLLDGRAVKSCTVFAVEADGSKILTARGLSIDGELHPLQRAFWDQHALQCGYCTPGMLMSAYALLMRNADPSDDEIRRAIAGNLCMCTGYLNIIKAIRAAARALKTPKGRGK